MKKITSILLCILMIFCVVVGCGNNPIVVEPTEINGMTETSETPSALELMLNESDTLRQAILDSPTEITVGGTSYYVSNKWQ